MDDEWTATTLGDVTDITIGRTPARKTARYWTTDLANPFCTIADMTGSVIDPRREGVTEAAISEGKAKKAPAGSLLMSFKLTIGRVGFAARDLFPNEAIAWLRATSPEVDERYLALWLSNQDLTAGSGRAVKGNTLNGDSLRAIQVMLPPRLVQRRIVDLMAHLDNHLANLRAEKGELVRVGDVIRREHFWPASDLPTLTLGEAADWYSGATPKSGATEFYAGGTIPWAVIADVANAPISSTATNITEAGLKEIRHLAPPGSVLVTMYGTIGRVAITEVPMATNQAIAWGVAKEHIAPKYLYHALRSLALHLDSLGRGATQRNINREILREQVLPIHSEGQQNRIIRDLDAFEELERALAGEIVALESMRGVLLSKLLSGVVTVPVTYDLLVREVA